MNLPHIVIVGGGFGGLDAARAFRNAPVRVTLVDRHNYHLFQPLLYQVATASLSPADIASPIRWILRRQRNVEVLLAEARAIDPATREVTLDRGSLTYDHLIIAAGSSHAYFGHPEWATYAPGLKTLDDAIEMRRRVLLAFEGAERESDPAEQRRLLTFVIVGGGATGVELAGALAEIARQSLRDDFRRIRPETSRIVILEGGPTILPAFPPPLQFAARESLERLGVEVRTNSMVVGVDGRGVMWRSAAPPPAAAPGGKTPPADARSPERIEAETVLWAAGVAASPVAKSLDVTLDRAGRIPAEPTLRVPGRPEIFVVGDLCALAQDGQPLPGVAQVAKQEGAHAAKNILLAIEQRPLEPFRYRDYGTMAVIGRGSAIGVVGGAKLAGFFGWLFWVFVHIFWLIGFRNRIVVFTEWAWAYFTWQRRVRLITGERLPPP
jgi:NADH:ubiquinone reductase (H+-translocating)